MKPVVFLVVITVVMVISFTFHALASGQSEPNPVFDDERNPSINSTTGDYPLLMKLSDNGNYLVKLAWPQLPLNADNAFDLQIFFLDPRDPTGTNGTVAQLESNSTRSDQDGGSIVAFDTQEH